MNRDDALRKLRALLSLTKARGASEQEAETAMRQARKLMDQFEIEESDVIESDLGAGDSVIVEEVTIDLLTLERNVLSTVVGRLFDCQTRLESRGDSGGIFKFHGYGPDVQVACWMYKYLIECAIQHASSYAQTIIADRVASEQTPPRIKRAMAAYHRGFLRRLASRVAELKEERDGSMGQAIKSLVVHKRSAIESKFGEFKYETAKYVDPEGLEVHVRRGAGDADGIDLAVRGIASESA